MWIDYSDRAHRDLEAAIDNLLQVSKRAAEEFGEAHDRAMESIRNFPHMGVSEAAGVLSFPIDKSGYRFVYRVRGDAVRILRLRNVRRTRAK